MTDRLDYGFQVVETAIRVIYADITRLEVDALLSTDDVHLSRVEPNGVAAAIRAAAGDVPRDDARKHALPAPLGSVLATSAGRLGAKYILHAMTVPAIVTEIEDITRTLDQRERQIQQIKEQHAAARHDLDLLQRSRQLHQP